MTRDFQVRPAAGPADLTAITRIAQATGQDEDWEFVYPAYLRHLLGRGRLVVAERSGVVSGYGCAITIGNGPRAITMLTDLFVDPGTHGEGAGQAILAAIWKDQARRITFSSLHANALPLYTRFGADAWWPLLYVSGDVRRLTMPGGWSVQQAGPDRAGALELGWTGFDRTADHRFWASWPNGTSLTASRDGQTMAAGTAGGSGTEYGICHLAVAPSDDASARPGDSGARHAPAAGPPPGRSGPSHDDGVARDAVLAVLAALDPGDGQARVCLPAPHPAVRPLLGAGWRVTEFDLHMATEFGLLDARRAVLSPGLA